MSLVDKLLNSLDFSPRGQVIARELDHCGEIIVSDHKGYRTLRFDGICEQSKMCISAPQVPVHNYIKTMLMAVAWQPPASALILGLGGGGLVRALHAYDANMLLEVVELRQAVVSVARRYFTLPAVHNITMHIADAADFLQAPAQRRYDLIFSDLYSAFTMDPQQGTQAFLAQCAERLSDPGWLVLNYHEVPDEGSLLYHSLHRVFNTVLYCVAPSGNVIIYAALANTETPLSLLRRLSAEVGPSFSCDLRYLSRKIERLHFS
ncbi:MULTISPECIES: spermidine synthase [Serratia]|jgi:predicted membrane-bound spermidine synthase|uniref:spermidine synthase n=1 Tax=Serratia TaxID=613 RepID=UPI0003583B95|nr:fused MFS/spermidine synthase [Serratia liquefaciens]AGQ31109.1 spermidine synthase [Serratia liquefaciens ATCC 27592]AKE10509.1 spermidine synthase [Serratia liquefaciens]MBF8105081.1 fused MFS/spermidine synthase [Serratia liquefaciens]MBI6160360.1 fused MFS/spermidine synthase [Serratia liquefaciens]MBV0841904.1 fused MFS/spermidine synthase [Serratia liquefaciens]